MATGVGLGASLVEQGGTIGSGAKRWIALFVVLAAGWGTLFGYSAVFLSEDLPFRPAAPPSAEPPPFGFPPMPHAIAAASVTPAPGPPAPHVVAEVPPAVAPAPAAVPRVERTDYVGIWGPTEAACGRRSRRRGYLPATITPERATAGRTVCSFRDGHRIGNAWTLAADCSERGRRWFSQVRLVVDGDRLTWSSGKGSASYIRCGRRAG